MYHIRRVADGEERSMHKDDLKGLEMAVREAVFRTGATGVSHEVYDDVKEKVIYNVAPPELSHNEDAVFVNQLPENLRFNMEQERTAERWGFKVKLFLLSAVLVALVLNAWING